MTVAVVTDFEFECSCLAPPSMTQTHSAGCLISNHARAAVYAAEHDGIVPLMAMMPEHWMAPWKLVASQLPAKGEPGTTYEELDPGREFGTGKIDALLHRDKYGRLMGVLYYYRVEFGTPGHFPYQPAGSVSMWVDPGWHRKGIGRVLALEAIRRWPELDLAVQNYTPGGLAMARVAQEARAAVREGTGSTVHRWG